MKAHQTLAMVAKLPSSLLLFLAISILNIFPLTYANEVPVSSQSEPETPLLLVLSFDGLRADFLNEVLTPNLWKLAREGVWAPNGVRPQVVTETAPNYYTIVTGLYQENHGIIGNTFYDPDLKERYDYWNWYEGFEAAMKSRDSKWYSGEPIWQTNEKVGRFSGGMRWPLCDARVNNMTMSRCFPWEDHGNLATWTNELDLLLTWFNDKRQPINLGFLYISEPDHIEHENDIYSPKVKAKLAELDALVWNLMRKLKVHNLQDKMNILFVSDHGHANMYTEYNFRDGEEILDRGDYIRSSISIFPNPLRGVKAEDLYKKLEAARLRSPRFNVWLKKDVPDRYHYKNNKRIGPIVVLEHLGYSISTSRPEKLVYGTHGYSNDYFEMRAAFFASGPAFRRNLTIDWEIENVDLYNLMAAVLGVKPARNDGNFSRVQRLLNSSDTEMERAVAQYDTGGTARVFRKVQLVLQLLVTWLLVTRMV